MGFERFATFIRATVVSLNHFHAMSPSENEKLAAEKEGRKNKKKKMRNRLTKREYKRKRRIDGNKRNRLKSGRGVLGWRVGWGGRKEGKGEKKETLAQPRTQWSTLFEMELGGESNGVGYDGLFGSIAPLTHRDWPDSLPLSRLVLFDSLLPTTFVTFWEFGLSISNSIPFKKNKCELDLQSLNLSSVSGLHQHSALMMLVSHSVQHFPLVVLYFSFSFI